MFQKIKDADPGFLEREAKAHFKESEVLQEKYRHTGFEAYFASLLRGKENTRDMVLAHIGKKLSKKDAEAIRWGSFIDDAELQKIAKAYGLGDEQSKRKLEQARYKPLDTTFRIQNNEAQKELVEELKASGVLGDVVTAQASINRSIEAYDAFRIISKLTDKNPAAAKAAMSGVFSREPFFTYALGKTSVKLNDTTTAMKAAQAVYNEGDYWYTSESWDLENIDDKMKLLTFLKGESARGREQNEGTVSASEPGSDLFAAVESFVKKMSKEQGSEKAYATLDQIRKIAGNALTPTERKAFSAVITYLEAKNIKGK